MTLDRAAVARLIDHTLLKPEATPADVAALCKEAGEFGVLAVCVSPSMLPIPAGALDAGIRTAAVIGFPSGAHQADVKAAEAAGAVANGADEVDMVIDLGLARSGDWRSVQDSIVGVREAAPSPCIVKVIIEAALLDDAEIVAACRAAEAAGADFVKTSTGFHPSGGATIHAVRLMRDTVGDRLGVKASGGIRTTETALAMIGAGANRLGTSSTAAILASL
ncbi:MAG: deoxyribose-phosphate aldolase [Acidimicrobiaceae bacterium]|jgi:deoxyribose-phosphate aldolase|nr:deoxyribose-phosphate aldolase [Acidimicrobiaceae bacterium]